MQVTAVSSKTNTTGVARLGAFTEGTSQVALYDTPGVVHTRYSYYFLIRSSCYDTCMACWDVEFSSSCESNMRTHSGCLHANCRSADGVASCEKPPTLRMHADFCMALTMQGA